ncbi:hypothetical protein KW785_03290 [Candidatus Parcubacteria bacterium]|nr:hypothetical protein [Candidatus Parcubacteria bacterium]
MNIGVLLYTYNRTDDAKINLEIIRNVWSKHESLKNVTVVHSYNGEKEWWPEKYLEDELIYLPNPGHFAGAELLINEGVKIFAEKFPDIDYVILLASDTWLVKPEYLVRVIMEMQTTDKYLAASVWGSKMKSNLFKRGASLDFNIFNLKWAITNNLFPLRYAEFREKYQDLFFYFDETVYLEVLFMVRFLEAISHSIKISSDNLLKPVALEHVRRLREREPIHEVGSERRFFKIDFWRRNMYWPDIGLLTHHDPNEKRRALKKHHLALGDAGKRFLTSPNLDYYNRGLKKNVFIKNKKRIEYGD